MGFTASLLNNTFGFTSDFNKNVIYYKNNYIYIFFKDDVNKNDKTYNNKVTNLLWWNTFCSLYKQQLLIQLLVGNK